MITSAWSVRLWRVAAIGTSLEAAAAWLCRQHCEIALHELAPMLGLSRADSVPNLTLRIDAGLRSHPRLADDLKEIMARIGRKPKIGLTSRQEARERRIATTVKPFAGTLRVTNPARKSRASSRKRVLHDGGQPPL